MKKLRPTALGLFTILLSVMFMALPLEATAETAKELERSARNALKVLYSSTPGASELGKKAAGVLVFPDIVKGGFIVAAQYGNGVLFKGNSVAGYYNSTAGSWGLQAGAQKFSYAMFFMTPDDLNYLNQSAGWEIGATPGLTVLDKGFGTSISSSTLQKGIYAFFFEQKGLMGGLSLQGTKVTKFHPKR